MKFSVCCNFGIKDIQGFDQHWGQALIDEVFVKVCIIGTAGGGRWGVCQLLCLVFFYENTTIGFEALRNDSGGKDEWC